MGTIKSKKHLMYVAQFSCLICGSDSVQVAHIRHLPSGNIGMSRKSDQYTVPLCFKCHQEQHGMNERKFWRKYNINPMRVAKILCLKSPCNKVKDFNETTDYFKEGNNE
jgi:hypothetical protein